MMMLLSPNFSSKSHFLLLGKTAVGVPYRERAGENQSLNMALSQRSIYPRIGVDLIVAISDVIGWIDISRPKPGLDEGIRALDGVPTASILIEGRTVRVFVWVHNSTPGIVVGMSTAIRTLDSTGLIAMVGHGASKGGVNGNRVRGDVVHAFKDVELALVGPVVQAGLPDGRPRGAALWHVSHVEAVDGRR